MEIFFYIPVLFLLIILLIIFVPIQFVLSTTKGMIGIFYGKWFSVGLKMYGDNFLFYYRFPFKNHYKNVIEELATQKLKSENSNRPVNKKKRSSKWAKAFFQRIKTRWRNVLNALKIKEMDVNIDTDDYILNAYLFPVFQYLRNRYHKPLSINFMGINRVELRVRTRLADLLYALLK